MSTRLSAVLVGLCGILGAVAFGVYGSSVLVPFPPANATAAQVTAFAAQYHDAMLFSTWLQAIGAFLLVVFVVALVHLAGVATRFAARLTYLVAAVILAVVLSEGAFQLDVIQATTNGHAEAALTSFDLAYVFVHVFALAPSLILMLGIALLGTQLLPRVFIYLALALGVAMQIVGFVGLFLPMGVPVFIQLLVLQTFWYAAAGIMLIIRAGNVAETTGTVVRTA
jgi:hypothetical protein